MARTTNASVEVMRALARGKGTFKVRFPEHGRHIEGDLSRQVIALISGGKAQRIYHTSSGAPATPTVLGSFKVYLKTPGTNAKGMVDSAYFIRGYATHGYPSVPCIPPATAASACRSPTRAPCSTGSRSARRSTCTAEPRALRRARRASAPRRAAEPPRAVMKRAR